MLLGGATDGVAVDKRWAWTVWVDADEETAKTAKKEAKRWAWTSWDDAADESAKKKTKRWAWTSWDDAAEEATDEAQQANTSEQRTLVRISI